MISLIHDGSKHCSLTLRKSKIKMMNSMAMNKAEKYAPAAAKGLENVRFEI